MNAFEEEAAEKAAVRVVHSLPGRVRMRLSRPPIQPDVLIDFVREHAGVGPITYTEQTGSLLVRFDPHVINADEIMLRATFRFALDQGGRPVRLLAAPEYLSLQNSAVVAGAALLTALVRRWRDASNNGDSPLDWLAGLSTAWSVLDHGYRELRSRGYFDPEVLTLAYLGGGMARGKILSASAVTWVATFGRHLVEMPSSGVQVEPVAVQPEQDAEPYFEMVVGPDTDAPGRLRLGLVGLLNGALRYAMTGGGAHGLKSFWEQLRDVSRVHGQMLEGHGQQRKGIPVRFHSPHF